MDVTINPISEVRQEADIHLSNDELQPHFTKAYLKYQKKVELKGFRKGKVPLDMIKKLFGSAIENETLDELASDMYRDAMTEREIKPLGTPSIVDMDFKRGEHFHFKIQYDVKPTIVLNKYKGIKVERLLHPVTDGDVENQIHIIRQASGTVTEVQSVTDSEHTVIGDVQELDDAGTPIIGKRTPNGRFYLADPTLVREIKDALKAAAVGQTYRAAFESQHGDHAHKVNLEIAVKKIEKMNLAMLDGELVKKMTGGKLSTPEEMTKHIREDLENRRKDLAERDVEESIAREIVQAHDVPVPDSMVNAFLDSFLEETKNRNRERRLPKDFDENKFREENRAGALWQSKWMLLKERIAEVENLTVTDEELEKLAEGEAARTGIDKERLVDYYKTSKVGTERILDQKLMAFLKSHSNVVERVVEPAESS